MEREAKRKGESKGETQKGAKKEREFMEKGQKEFDFRIKFK